MRKLIACLTVLVLPLSAAAGDDARSEVEAASTAFNKAYATNDVATYMGFYAEGAVVYWFGERQDLAAYHEEWAAMIEAGGGVEVNELSDKIFQVLPGGEVVIASYFVDNTTRSPDGEKTSARAYESEVWQKIDGHWKVVSLHYSEI